MYSEQQIEKYLFIDIETVSEYRTLTDLLAADSLMGKMWSKRCEYLRRRYPENEKVSDAQLYTEKAALHAEFSKIVCISMGTFNVKGIPSQIRTFVNTNEEILLQEFMNFIKRYFEAYQGEGKIIGHNIKRFDIPYIMKRAYKYAIEIPYPLIDVSILKPWESPIIDTSEMWGFGAWQESFISLEILTHHLNIPSPKDVMHADQVGYFYWENDNIDLIAKYCSYDVIATINVILKICGLEILEYSDFNISTS